MLLIVRTQSTRANQPRCSCAITASLLELKSPTTLPVGYGEATPVVTERALEQGDRVLFLTDGVVEEDRRGGADGQARLRVLVERVSDLDGSVGLTRSLPNDARLPPLASTGPFLIQGPWGTPHRAMSRSSAVS